MHFEQAKTSSKLSINFSDCCAKCVKKLTVKTIFETQRYFGVIVANCEHLYYLTNIEFGL